MDSIELFPRQFAVTTASTNPWRSRPAPMIRWLACLVMSLLLLCTAALAQVDSGQIAGTITDTLGAVVPGATVTVTNSASNSHRAVQSSGTGAYVVVGLEPGTYQITVTAGAFKPFKENVEVTVGGHVTIDAKISVN